MYKTLFKLNNLLLSNNYLKKYFSSMARNCIFCNILDRKTETEIEFENDTLIIFKDIKPVSNYHYLAVSKVHIDSVKCLKIADTDLINNMESSLREHMKGKGVDTNDALFGFHWPPFISVKHLHMHGISPVSNMSLMSRGVYKPGSLWFSTADYTRNWLK